MDTTTDHFTPLVLHVRGNYARCQVLSAQSGRCKVGAELGWGKYPKVQVRCLIAERQRSKGRWATGSTRQGSTTIETVQGTTGGVTSTDMIAGKTPKPNLKCPLAGK